MSDEVTIRQFAEQLKDESRWYDLGVFLEVSTSELDHISRTYPHYGTTRCLQELYKCIQSSDRRDGKKLTWNEIVEALKIMQNIRLADNISSATADTMSIIKESSARENDSVIVNKMVSGEFFKIVQAFAELVITFMESIDAAVKNGCLNLVKLQLYLSNLCGDVPIRNAELTIEELFSGIKGEYCFLHYSILSSIAEKFKLPNEMIGKYTEKLEDFKTTSQVIDVLDEIHDKVNRSYQNYNMIELKLRDFWGKRTIQKFDCFVKQLLLDMYSFICSFTITPGCICVRWLFAKHNFDTQKLPPLEENFLKVVGVTIFKMNDTIIYEGPNSGCETVEGLFLQAIELNNARGIEMLLAIANLPDEILYTLVSSVIGITDLAGYTVLYYACIFGHLDVVKLLLESGASPDFVGTENSMTLLVIACEHCQIEIAKLLIEKGASADPHHYKVYTPLMVACSEGLNEIVQLMLSKTSFKSTVNFQHNESKGLTALHFASSRGYSEVVLMLITAGADYELTDYEGLTPLMEACRAGHKNVADIFLFKYDDVCGDINASTIDGRTALYFSSMNGHDAIVQKLLAQKADFHASNEFFSPLKIANEKGFVKIIHLLVSCNNNNNN